MRPPNSKLERTGSTPAAHPGRSTRKAKDARPRAAADEDGQLDDPSGIRSREPDLAGRIGDLFGWDHQRPAWNAESYADRLSPADRAQPLVAPGTSDRSFRLLYRFEDEQLSELRNATVHAFVSLSIRPTPAGRLAYLRVFVRPVHRFTRRYMGAITPFRRLVVYPAIIRRTQRAWAERYDRMAIGTR